MPRFQERRLLSYQIFAMFADVELMSFDLDVPDQAIRSVKNIQV